jgi:sec-independent protein translocase protein TatA
MDVGPVELLIVLAVFLLLFGSKKLPELARGMGQAAKEFRSGLHDADGDDAEPPA